jgi:SAM-dependent methyltransferase
MTEIPKWYESWFDSPYYHILYKDRDHDEAELFIKKLIDHLGLQTNSKVIDLGCGKGRHSLFLAENRMDVLGIDLSEQSINEAKESSQENLKFKVGDMRDPLGQNQFDAVFNLFTSFGYFDDSKDDLSVISNVADSLRLGGIFVQDFLNKNWVENTLIPLQTVNRHDIEFQIERKIEGNHVIKSIKFEDGGKEYNFTEDVKLLDLNDFKEMYQKSGLDIQNIYGDYNLSEYIAESSPRLIIVSKK